MPIKEGKTPQQEALDGCASLGNGCFGCMSLIIIATMVLLIISWIIYG